jgi:hypothetical protein
MRPDAARFLLNRFMPDPQWVRRRAPLRAAGEREPI